jgi:hypothetical protein
MPDAVVSIGERSAISDEFGAFVVNGIPAGVRSFQVRGELSSSAGGEMLLVDGFNFVRIGTARQDLGSDGMLSGRTIDGCSGEPLSGVTVRLPMASREVTSGHDGTYQLGSLCCSTLGEVTASKPGYKTTRTALGRAYGSGIWLDLVLTPN